MAGSIDETYQAALHHGLVDVEDATLVGVVRRAPAWFNATVEENHPALGPPAELLDETKARTDDLKLAGLCDEEAHNAAWDEVGFSRRYEEYLQTDPDAAAAVTDLLERASAGEDLVLVCFERDGKRCHRHLLKVHLEERLGE